MSAATGEFRGFTAAGSEPAFGTSSEALDPRAPVESRLKYFFLCGHPRSGTNWLSNILNLHPRIHCRGEFHFDVLRHAMDVFVNRAWHVASAEPTRSEAERAFQDLVRRTMATIGPEKPGAEWIGDQTPRRFTPLIPGAPTFLIERDGRDVIVSLTFHWLLHGGPPHGPGRAALAKHREVFQRDPHYYRSHPSELLSSDSWVRHAAAEWAAFVLGDREMVRKVLSSEIDGRVHVVRYEELHADTEGQRANAYRFLGLDPEEALPLSDDTKTTPGVKGDENPLGHLRAGKVRGWEKYFTDDVKRWFKESAGEALVEMGYEKDLNW